MKKGVRGPGLSRSTGLSPDGLRAAYLAETRDGQCGYCPRCGVEVWVDTDRAGGTVDYDYVGGSVPRMVTHRCARVMVVSVEVRS